MPATLDFVEHNGSILDHRYLRGIREVTGVILAGNSREVMQGRLLESDGRENLGFVVGMNAMFACIVLPIAFAFFVAWWQRRKPCTLRLCFVTEIREEDPYPTTIWANENHSPTNLSTVAPSLATRSIRAHGSMVSLPSLATGSIRAHASMVSFNLDNIFTEKDTQASAEEEETNPQVSEESRKEKTEKKKKKKKTKSKNRAKSNETEDNPRPRIARHTHRIYEGGNQIRTESTRKPKVSSSSSSKRKTSSSKRVQMTGDLQMAG